MNSEARARPSLVWEQGKRLWEQSWGLEELVRAVLRCGHKAWLSPWALCRALWQAGSRGSAVRTKGSDLPKTPLPVPRCVTRRGRALALSTLGWLEASRAR